MEVVYLLVSLAVVLAVVVVWAFFWAVRSGQFDDLEGPAHRILMDDDPGAGTGGRDASGPDKDNPNP
jgi:cbb3-type cytochrome oxidase maturation protein